MASRKNLPKHKLIAEITDLEQRLANMTNRVKEVQREALEEREQSEARRQVISEYESRIRRLRENEDRLLRNLIETSSFATLQTAALNVYREELLRHNSRRGDDPRILLQNWQWDSEKGWTRK